MKDFYIEVGESIRIHKDTVWTLWFLAKDSLEERDVTKFTDILEILKRTKTDFGGTDLTIIISSLESRYKKYQNEVLPHFGESRTFAIQDNSNEEYDINLFNKLRNLRRELAAERDVPAYLIFHDSVLKAMATYLPQDSTSLEKINGVGMKKIKEFGDVFLSVIVEYCKQNGVTLEYKNGAKTESTEKFRNKPSRAYELWTKEEEEKLISEYNSGRTIEELMEMFGRQKGGIISRIKKLHL